MPKELILKINRMLRRLQDTRSQYEHLNIDQSHMKYLKGLGRRRKTRDTVTNMEELTDKNDVIDLSMNGKYALI